MFYLKVFQALNKHKVDYAVVGGFAVSLHGLVRGTLDLDIVIALSESQYQAAERALHAVDLESRLPITAQDVFRFRKEYIQNRNLITWSFTNPRKPSEIVDIVITHDRKKMKIIQIPFRDIKIRVAAAEELIKMKSATARPQDIEDIKALKGLKK